MLGANPRPLCKVDLSMVAGELVSHLQTPLAGILTWITKDKAKSKKPF